jgi:hypothetical protein
VPPDGRLLKILSAKSESLKLVSQETGIHVVSDGA